MTPMQGFKGEASASESSQTLFPDPNPPCRVLMTLLQTSHDHHFLQQNGRLSNAVHKLAVLDAMHKTLLNAQEDSMSV